MRCGVCQNKLIVPENDSACMCTECVVEVLTPAREEGAQLRRLRRHALRSTANAGPGYDAAAAAALVEVRALRERLDVLRP